MASESPQQLADRHIKHPQKMTDEDYRWAVSEAIKEAVEAERAKAEAVVEAARELVRGIDATPCVCGPEYRKRDMTDPSCPYHGIDLYEQDLAAAREALDRYDNGGAPSEQDTPTANDADEG